MPLTPCLNPLVIQPGGQTQVKSRGEREIQGTGCWRRTAPPHAGFRGRKHPAHMRENARRRWRDREEWWEYKVAWISREPPDCTKSPEEEYEKADRIPSRTKAPPWSGGAKPPAPSVQVVGQVGDVLYKPGVCVRQVGTTRQRFGIAPDGSDCPDR